MILILKKSTYLLVLITLIALSCTSKKKSESILPVNKMNTVKNTGEVHQLKNKFLTLKVKTKGAEIAGLRTADREYIWQANPEVWPRHAPILFPIVGRLIDHEYIYNGTPYPMVQHGFARDNDFKVIDTSKNSITFEQRATETSKKTYPFDFILQVKYTLSGKFLHTEYTVKNPSKNERLYFSIGAHPGFNCPFETDQARNEYDLVFDKALTQESQLIDQGLRTGETNKVFSEEGIISLHDSIFDNDALIFDPNPFSKVTFVHRPSQKKYLSVTFKNFPYLGIWSPSRDSPFVCIEPWHGITDRTSHNKKLQGKEGILTLTPKEFFSCGFTIEVY